MQFFSLTALLALVTFVTSQNDDTLLSVILGDIQQHQSEYLSYIQAGNAVPSGVLQVYQQVSTYTDDSYTTLFSQIDQSAVSTFITGVPWYSSRLQSVLAAETGESDSSEATESSSDMSESESSSEMSESSSDMSESSSSMSESNGASGSTSATSTTSGSGASTGKDSGSLFYLIAAFAFALGSPALLL